jgi:hypothetical protein
MRPFNYLWQSARYLSAMFVGQLFRDRVILGRARLGFCYQIVGVALSGMLVRYSLLHAMQLTGIGRPIIYKRTI